MIYDKLTSKHLLELPASPDSSIERDGVRLGISSVSAFKIPAELETRCKRLR